MKKTLKISIILALSLMLIPISVFADVSTGTPSPGLFPVFGTLINFDDKATGTIVNPDDYEDLGVASIREIEQGWTLSRYPGTQSNPNYVGTGPDAERGTDWDLGWDGTILIELANPTNKIGIGIANSKGGRELLKIYDSNFHMLESYTLPSGRNTYVVFTRDQWEIKYLEITGDWFAIDDLQFNPQIIDIKPGTGANKINLKKKGIITVGVLNSHVLDIKDVDPSTVSFAGAAPVRWKVKDVDHDGVKDLLFYFNVQDLDLDENSTEATLTGTTFDGTPFAGTDSVTIIGSKK
ncbi:MAG: hypothetical protein GTO18_16935 [Anaerolineales bacterium]|nr:hypothetical protein [Anaerolineales bacterium]